MLKEVPNKTIWQQIQYYKNALELDAKVWDEIAKEPLDAQLAELKVMHHIRILFAKKKLRANAATH